MNKAENKKKPRDQKLSKPVKLQGVKELSNMFGTDKPKQKPHKTIDG